MGHYIAISCFLLAGLFWGMSSAGGGLFFVLLAVTAEGVVWYRLFVRDKRGDTEQ